MSKKHAIGKKIHQGIALKKLVSDNQFKAVQRRNKLVKELNTVIDNVDKRFTFEQVMRAKTALRKLYAQSHALDEKPSTNNKDSWCAKGKRYATGKQKAKRLPSQPRVEFSRKS